MLPSAACLVGMVRPYMLHLSLLVSTPVLLGLDGATGVASDPP